MSDEGFKTTDRRRLRPSQGLVLDTSVERAKEAAATRRGRDIIMRAPGDTNPFSRGYQRPTDDVAAEMRLNRRVAMRRQGALGDGMGGGSGGFMMATARPRDPMFYWRQNNLPYDTNSPAELAKIRAFCRLLYQTHPIVAACTDIFTKFPLQGMEFVCKDSKLEDFYGALFVDQLKYPKFLKDVNREYWLTGEAWPLGSFSETLGVWQDEELLNPDNVTVEQSPLLKEPRFLIELPETLRKVLQNKSPKWEYEAIVRSFPELLAYTGENSRMPVSNMLMQQLKFTGDTFNPRGVPILLRGFRPIIQEEMLNAAMDAVADRLYTPLLLVRLGASASDLGTEVPWIPTRDDLDAFNEELDLAMSADFRVLTHHFATQIDSVFGRENMPDMSADFDRIEDRILMVYGLSRTMLQGADCLTGDTEISVRRAGKTFKMTIKEVAARFNGLDGHLPGRRWRSDIPTYVAYAQDGVIRQGLLDAAWYSGVKEVFELTTESGRSITASAKHPFLTPSGDFVQLGDLRVGDFVQVKAGRRETAGGGKRSYYRQAKVRFHPYQVSDGISGKFKVPVHRLVMEAALNDLEYAEFIRIVRQEEIRAKELYFIDPQVFTVHHKDEDHLNNSLTNLALMSRGEHHVHHVRVENVLEQVGSERIVSIEPRGKQNTYDLGMAEDPHNFLANGFVVHNSGETYAADALNREVVTQLLSDNQQMIKDFVRERMLIVAEAQEHYDYDERNGKRYVKMEEVVEYDEETGQEKIVQQPALLVPELKFDTMNLRDEQVERQFSEELNASGVPVPYTKRLAGTGLNFDDMIEQRKQEDIKLAIAEQETRLETYMELRAAGLPIPDDLRKSFEPKATPVGQSMVPQSGDDAAIPSLGTEVHPLPALAPTPDDVQQDTDEQMAPVPAQPGSGSVIMLPSAQVPPEGFRPPESDEQRAGMPKPAVRKRATKAEGERVYNYKAQAIRAVTDQYHVQPQDHLKQVTVEGQLVDNDYYEAELANRRPSGRFGAPSHVGMRRYLMREGFLQAGMLRDDPDDLVDEDDQDTEREESAEDRSSA